MLCDRINAQDRKERNKGILAVSRMVEDVWDALFDYQVRDDEAHAAAVDNASDVNRDLQDAGSAVHLSR